MSVTCFWTPSSIASFKICFFMRQTCNARSKMIYLCEGLFELSKLPRFKAKQIFNSMLIFPFTTIKQFSTNLHFNDATKALRIFLPIESVLWNIFIENNLLLRLVKLIFDNLPWQNEKEKPLQFVWKWHKVQWRHWKKVLFKHFKMFFGSLVNGTKFLGKFKTS